MAENAAQTASESCVALFWIFQGLRRGEGGQESLILMLDVNLEVKKFKKCVSSFGLISVVGWNLNPRRSK